MSGGAAFSLPMEARVQALKMAQDALGQCSIDALIAGARSLEAYIAGERADTGAPEIVLPVAPTADGAEPAVDHEPEPATQTPHVEAVAPLCTKEESVLADGIFSKIRKEAGMLIFTEN